MNEERHERSVKLAPGKLNSLQAARYPTGEKPLDIRVVWFLLQLRRVFIQLAAVIEEMIEAENQRY